MPPKIDIEEVRRLIKKELEPINEKLASLEEKYNTLSQTGDFASAKLSTIKYWNSWTININNNVGSFQETLKQMPQKTSIKRWRAVRQAFGRGVGIFSIL